MSVIRFDKEQTATLERSLAEGLAGGYYSGLIERVVRNSEPYREWWTWHTTVAHTKGLSAEDLQQEIINRACWYWLVANRTAFALQYRKEPGFFEDDAEGPRGNLIINADQLREELCHLSYNLSTNDGNRFLAEPWDDLLRDLINALGDHILFGQRQRQDVAAACS